MGQFHLWSPNIRSAKTNYLGLFGFTGFLQKKIINAFLKIVSKWAKDSRNFAIPESKALDSNKATKSI